MTEQGINPPIQVCSFFSGAGLLDLGFEDIGFHVVFVNEIYRPFIDAHRYARERMGMQLPQHGYHCGSVDDADLDASLSEVSARALQDGAILGFIGGPPCPDFSVAGKNRGQDGDNGRLSVSYTDLILRHEPDFFIFENVKGLYRTKKHRAFFNDMRKRLASVYVCHERLINALEYGAPQDRQRIILFGVHKRLCLADVGVDWSAHTRYPENTTSAYPWPAAGETNRPDSVPDELTVDYWFRKNHVQQHPNAPHHFKPRSGLTKFQRILEGDDSRKSYKRLHRYRYSPTAAYGHNEVHIHPVIPRRISAAEAMAIQSLPEKFELPPSMSLTDMFKTIGNGVPYLAARGIAATVYDTLYPAGV